MEPQDGEIKDIYIILPAIDLNPQDTRRGRDRDVLVHLYGISLIDVVLVLLKGRLIIRSQHTVGVDITDAEVKPEITGADVSHVDAVEGNRSRSPAGAE